jgi:hypothetical protein
MSCRYIFRVFALLIVRLRFPGDFRACRDTVLYYVLAGLLKALKSAKSSSSSPPTLAAITTVLHSTPHQQVASKLFDMLKRVYDVDQAVSNFQDWGGQARVAILFNSTPPSIIDSTAGFSASIAGAGTGALAGAGAGGAANHAVAADPPSDSEPGSFLQAVFAFAGVQGASARANDGSHGDERKEDSPEEEDEEEDARAPRARKSARNPKHNAGKKRRRH